MYRQTLPAQSVRPLSLSTSTHAQATTDRSRSGLEQSFVQRVTADELAELRNVLGDPDLTKPQATTGTCVSIFYGLHLVCLQRGGGKWGGRDADLRSTFGWARPRCLTKLVFPRI